MRVPLLTASTNSKSNVINSGFIVRIKIGFEIGFGIGLEGNFVSCHGEMLAGCQGCNIKGILQIPALFFHGCGFNCNGNRAKQGRAATAKIIA